MSFLTPLYLAGAALIALPIVLHLLRRDVAPPLPFTAVRLLRVSPIERSRRRRLRDLLLLAARIGALLLLAASFARPYFAGAAPSARTTVVAVDRSFSMSAPGVMERARALARTAVDEAGADRVAVIAFDQRADVVAASGAASDARAAIDDIVPTFGATRYASALEKAAELLPEGAPGRLVVIGDLQRSGFDGGAARLPPGIELMARDAGGPSTNLAVTDVRPDGSRLIATVRNFGAAARQTDVRLEVNGRTELTRRVTVRPGASTEVSFDGVAGRAAVDVVVADPDGFAADNTRYALNESRAVPRVVIVGGGPGATSGFYLARALEADDESGRAFDVRIVQGRAFAAMNPSDVAAASVIAILSTHGLDRRAGDAVRALLGNGGGLLIAAAPDVDPSVLSSVLDWQPPLSARDRANTGVLAVTDLRHPIFRPFDAVAANLGQVVFDRAWQVQPAAPWRVIANYTRGMPAVLERSAGQGRIVLFTSDLDRRWNDFPLHPAFVPFVQETVRYLGAHAPEAASYLVADVPAGIAPQPGIIQAEGRMLAVNVDVRESAIDRVTPGEFTRMVARAAAPSAPPADTAVQTEARQGYWRYGLMLMLAALVAECFVGSR